jgi:hypothetical protein
VDVFISWSGPTSRRIAEILHDWLPDTIQALRPWISTDDIDKGTRWSAEVATKLQSVSAGIICLTPDNVHAQWLHFEAGALAKTLERTHVCPYLFQLRPSDVSGPLAQFQLTTATKDDTLKLVKTLNKAQGGPALAAETIERSQNANVA